MSQPIAFSVKNLVKSYNKTRVLEVADMFLDSGQFLALMGKNGSGKSTLMRLLAQQELFDEGEILYKGQSLLGSSIKLNPHLVFISEDQELPFPVALSDWVETYKELCPTFDELLFKNLIQQLEIDLDKSFHSLSRGQKLKALFCLQAPKKPDIYLLDEITSVLDAGSRWALMQFLKEEVYRGCLVVMSTNIASEMQGFATDATLLEKGKIIFSSKSAALKERFKKVRVLKDQERAIQAVTGAKRISYNTESTWTYMCDRTKGLPSAGFEEDAREITIADVQSYFTALECQI